MGFSLQDIISGALQDAQNGVTAASNGGNTLNQNLTFLARRNVPLVSGGAGLVAKHYQKTQTQQ